MSPREIQEIKDGGKPTVDLVFKVWAPKLNRLTHRLYLLGSLKQMGAWNIQEAVQGKPTSDFHTWRVDIRDVPIETIFEWSWVKAKPNRTDVKWERMVKRNRTVDCFGGVIHTIYGDGEEVFVQSATYAEVTTYRKVEQGQLLVLTGSTHTTGSWDLDKAINATECPISSGYWKVHVAFDPGSGLEFKWAIVKENPRKLHNILEKETHLIQGRQSWLRVVAPWNVSRVFIEDTPICLEPLDHVTGRTDVLVNAKKAHTESIRHWLKKDPRANTPALLPIKNVPAPKTAPFNVTTPRITNEHKAKEALKKFMSMSGSGPAKLSTGNVANRVPTVQPLENVADHVKKRSESIRGSERVNKEQERNPFKAGLSIKGKGQTHLARSSNQGCDAGDSCTSTAPPTASIDVAISEMGTTDALNDPSRLGVEHSDDRKPVVNYTEKHKEQPSGTTTPSRDEDSGFDTESQSYSLTSTIAELKRNDDKRDHDVQISSKEALNAKKDIEKNLKNPILDIRGENEQTYCTEMQSFDDKFNYDIPVPSYAPTKEESLFFEEDGYLDFLSRTALEEESLVKKFKQHKTVEIEYIMTQPPSVPKGYPDQISRDSEKKVTDLKLKQQTPAHTTENKGINKLEFDAGDWEIMHHNDYEPDTEVRRSIARMLEANWGLASDPQDSIGDRDKNYNIMDSKHFLHALKNKTPRPSSISFDLRDEAVLLSHETSSRENLVAQYSNTELANVIFSLSDNVDHRSLARNMERKWGLAAMIKQNDDT